MTPLRWYGGARRGRPLRWVRILAIPVLLMSSGCSDDDEPRPLLPTATPSLAPSPSRTPTGMVTATATPTTVPTPDRLAACGRLESCDPCFFLGQRGDCLDTSACAARLAAGDARCIAGVTACDDVVACFDSGCGGDRDCSESD